MFREHRGKIPAERHVRADKDAIPASQGKPHAFVVAVPDPDREPAALDLRFEVQDAEHLHAVRGHGVFILHDADVAEAESLKQRLNDLVMWNRTMRLR